MQRVIRPDQDFRGYAGQVVSGTIRPGDGILALPSGQRSRVKSIETFDGALEEAVAPMSVTLTLEDEVDISRGDMLASAQKPPDAARQFDASVVWMNEQPLDLSRRYVLKHTTQTLPAEVKAVKHRVNIKTLEHEPADRLEMNGIGVLRIETSRPIYFDAYTQNRATGSLILIDPETNATVGAGMILAPVIVERDRSKVSRAGYSARTRDAGGAHRALPARRRNGIAGRTQGARLAVGTEAFRSWMRGDDDRARLRRNVGGAGTGWFVGFPCFRAKLRIGICPGTIRGGGFRDRVARRGRDSVAE